MGEATGIQWTTHTFNPWIGCTRVSRACDECYADRGSRRLGAQHGLKLWDEGSSRFFTGASYWKQPATWNRKAARAGVRARVFCASYADVFEDRPELLVPRARLFGVVADTPWLDWLFLTKRPQNADFMWRVAQIGERPGLALVEESPWLPNIWLGTTVEGEDERKQRVWELAKVPAVVRFVSCEPLLELPYFGRDLMICENWKTEDSLQGPPWCPPWPKFKWKAQALVGAGYRRPFDWMIIGGESGPKARPFDPDWARNLVAQCRAAGVAPFVKQMGENPVGLKLRDRHGGEWDEWPEDLRIREYPVPRSVAK
jgi:protein gp37